jgi:urea transporter
MSAESSRWDELTTRSPVTGYLDVVLRGSGQVMFQNNPLTGLLFLVGIFWGAIDADMWEVGVGAVVGLVVATVTASLLAVEASSFKQGLYGFNGILVGAAVPTFLDVDGYVWVYLVVGAAVSTVVMLAVAKVFATWGVPALTFPFVLTTWFLVLGSWSFGRVEGAGLGPAALPTAPTGASTHLDASASMLAETLFRNISQVFLINNVVTGVIFVVALAVSSRWAAGFALIGSAVALGTAWFLAADAGSITGGLFGFSAVLTSIALGSVFYQPGVRVTCFALLGVVFTVITQGALDAALLPIGIPTFTMPFVIVTWLFLIPKEKFVPVHHKVLSTDVQSSPSAPTRTTPPTAGTETLA